MEAPQALKPLVPSELVPAMNVTLVTDGAGIAKLEKCAERIGTSKEPHAGLDCETNITVDFWDRRMRTLQFGDKYEQFVIDLLAFADGNTDKLVNTQGQYGENSGGIYEPFLKPLRPWLCSNKMLKVGVNLGFEYETLSWDLGVRIWNLFSTDMSERVIQAGIIYLKKYAEFSMQALCGRYLKVLIDKSQQRTFDLTSPLTPEQIEYAALDVRIPIPLRQHIMGVLHKEGLIATSIIENDAIPAYQDMHLVGQALDSEGWIRRIRRVEEERVGLLKQMDETFIPLYGRKSEAYDDVEIARLDAIWRTYNEATPEEKALAAQKRQTKDQNAKAQITAQMAALEAKRKEIKADAKEQWNVLKKDRTQKKKLIPKCEGEALINYGSNKQLLNALKQIRGLSGLESVADDALLEYNDKLIIQVIRKYRKGKKDTGTYGIQWTQKWVTKPCKEEGWLHPGDGRLHCTFNQLEAETGRSSSSKPNAQNLPQDDDVRACFICDPPNENIRISTCCDSETSLVTGEYLCTACGKPCQTKAEEYCIVTVDCAAAELRIIAELAHAKSWIQAFAKGWDVHSVSTEILYPEKWPTLTIKSKAKPDGWTLADCKSEKWPALNPDGSVKMRDGKPVMIGPCAYYAKDDKGEFCRQKCNCPEHKKLRDGTKATNFLLCYGGGPDALADAIGVTTEEAKKLMQIHEAKFPDIWNYLAKSGELAVRYREARDMYGRRRSFPVVTPERAREWIIDEKPERLELDEEIAEQRIFEFKAKNLREPNEEEEFWLTHREPVHKEILWGMRALEGSTARRGKNHCIQGSNASIMKRAMGCGFDKEGKPFLWHLLPQYKARLQSMVHDELIVHCPKRYGDQVLAVVGDAFKRAAAEVMTKVVMEYDGHVANRWLK